MFDCNDFLNQTCEFRIAANHTNFLGGSGCGRMIILLSFLMSSCKVSHLVHHLKAMLANIVYITVFP